MSASGGNSSALVPTSANQHVTVNFPSISVKKGDVVLIAIMSNTGLTISVGDSDGNTYSHVGQWSHTFTDTLTIDLYRAVASVTDAALLPQVENLAATSATLYGIAINVTGTTGMDTFGASYGAGFTGTTNGSVTVTGTAAGPSEVGVVFIYGLQFGPGNPPHGSFSADPTYVAGASRSPATADSSKVLYAVSYRNAVAPTSPSSSPTYTNNNNTAGTNVVAGMVTFKSPPGLDTAAFGTGEENVADGPGLSLWAEEI